ncbi:PREDICTED: aspartic proteinase-like protein 2 isoform X1 [Populus euphratica]|uniref:Aspartic proteinase-like protein 2 isoform X1 n=1 Tax=Populus euphratica TaxID=75702 RepID=A0AAJ6XCR4_POPEU|nr:PREDICTED: aspartic proteinase-like protein 2 isoform X1 [Populus euphratica]
MGGSRPPFIITILLLLLLLLLFMSVSVVYCASLLQLERAFPLNNHGLELSQLRARDRLRHTRLLQGFVGGVVDFSVQGSPDPYLVGVTGASEPLLYFTKVKLGSPPREFNVQIDTGSDVLWVCCNSCNNCPRTSGLGIQLNFFDSSSSSTAGQVHCSDPICTSAVQTTVTQCSPQTNQCSYTFQYEDGSGTSGYYVSDTLYFDAIFGESLVVNSSALIVFGCSTYQSGDLTMTDKAVDGIFGFGQGELSVISQLSTHGITPRVFSHCLKGEGIGGGILVLGEILEPGMVYSPLVPSQPHYNLNLQTIAVNGKLLPIDPSVFATSNSQGTIVDTGTTLAYLVAEAYDPFVSAVNVIVSPSVTPIISKGNQCYLVSTSVSQMFPLASFNFAGGASMVLKPEDYLIPFGPSQGGSAMWCIGFQKVQGVTILGDLVLKDKIFVYDLVRQRIGWANYDCSLSVNVSVTSSKDFISAGQLSVSSSSRDIMLFELLPLTVMVLTMHLLLLKFKFL